MGNTDSRRENAPEFLSNYSTMRTECDMRFGEASILRDNHNNESFV
jgi:hypothetical protein